MRAKAGVLIFISLLFLVGTVSAAVGIPDKIVVTTDKPWIVANNVDQSTITVTISNSTIGYSDPIQGVIVNLTVNNTIFGTLSPTQVTTDPYGMASSTFNVKTKSGGAQITATITSTGLSNSTIQNIDHNSAYYADFTYPLSGTVASPVTFNISLTDQYRNPVDHRTGNHIISLHVSGPAPDDCGFAEAGNAHDIFPILDANGNTSVIVKLTSSIGDNNIAMDGYESVPNQLKWIYAEANGVPFSITQDYSPSGSPPTLPADGVSYFTIIYNLFDEYGNPTNKQFLWVNTSIGEYNRTLSNNLGQVTVQYGPRSSIGEIYITATAVANSTVTTGPQMVKFKNTGAEIISLTANPDIMASRDVPPSSSVSNIIATVADISGNAVPGEMINFTIDSITYDGTIPSEYNVTADPILLNSSAITDVYGKATVQFIPGNFTTAGNPGFNASATGHCNVNAFWKNATPKTVPVTWKNYPYLSVSTSVTPLTVGINQTVDVSIAFKGDGWAFIKDSDVVLVTDVSGSMNSAGKLPAAKTALKKFVGLADGKMHLSLASYGKSPIITPPYGGPTVVSLYAKQVANSSLYPFNPYGTFWDRCKVNPNNWNNYGGYQNKQPDATIDLDFTKNSVTLNATIDSYTAVGGTNIAAGINAALLEFQKNGQPSHNWSIIIMSDGIATMAPINKTSLESYWPMDWNTSGPGGEDQSQTAKTAAIERASVAKAQNITIYSIGFGSIADTATLQSIASPDCYYAASDATSLNAVYGTIFEKVNDQAGVDTTMMADFQNINVTGVTIPGGQVYNYVYHPNASTKIGWQDGKTNVTNQSADWLDNKLDFTIGTIKVKQQWNATFRLRVNQSGIIDVFGKNSTVTFNGGTAKLVLPQTFITVVPNLILTNITAKTITLDNLTVTATGEIKVLLPVTWNTNYTGNKTLTEKVYYRIDSTGPWVQFDTKIHMYDPLITEYVDYAQLDVTKLPPGSYQIMVYATASDAPDATKMLNEPVNVGNRGRTYIKIQ